MKMTVKRFKALVSSFGTEVSRWPVADRDAALELLKANDEASAFFKSATALDAALAEMPKAAPADEAYLKRLATIPFASRSLGESAPTTFGEFMKGFFPARTLIPQGLGVAAMGFLGIWLGLTATFGEPDNVVELDATDYFLENSDLDKDVEDLR